MEFYDFIFVSELYCDILHLDTGVKTCAKLNRGNNLHIGIERQMVAICCLHLFGDLVVRLSQ